MIRYHTIWVILCQIVMCLGIFIMACGKPESRKENISSYYIPVDSLPTGGMVYTYRNVKDPEGKPEIWRHVRKGDRLLESTNFNLIYDFDSSNPVADTVFVQRQYDRMASNGVITDSLILFSTDSTGTVRHFSVHIISTNRFPFVPVDSTNIWLTHMEWWQPEDSLHVTLQRRRRFIGHTTWNNKGQSYPAVRFKTDDTFETERDGWSVTSWTGEEIYALNIGLVYYKRNISPELKVEFELEDRK
jgi:hypothetical protein